MELSQIGKTEDIYSNSAGAPSPEDRQPATVTDEVCDGVADERTPNVHRPRSISPPHARVGAGVGQPFAVRAERQAGYAAVAAFADDKRQGAFPKLSERESPDLVRVGALERCDGVCQGESRVGFVLDFPQREELLCLGALRLLEGPLL